MRRVALAASVFILAGGCCTGLAGREPAATGTPIPAHVTATVTRTLAPTPQADSPTPFATTTAQEDDDGGLVLIAPFASGSDLASINEAYSADENCPWGFEHRGLDFFPGGNLKPYLAVCSGVVDTVELWQIASTSNWQASVRLVCSPTYSAIYAFEPMSASQADGEAQLASIAVAEGQRVAQGDLVGALLVTNAGSHVDLGFYENGEPICPEPLFVPEARASILAAIHVVWPGARMCYH